MKNFLRSELKGLTAYVSGEQPQTSGWIKLNTNEFPYAPSPDVLRDVEKAITNSELLRRYPSADAEPLRSKLAEIYNLDKEDFIIGNGSDEILRLVCNATLSQDEFVATPKVSYSLYDTLVAIFRGQLDRVEMLSASDLPFRIDLNGLEESKANLVFLANPNAQTGEFIKPEKLKKIISKSQKLWLIDEAYNDFVSHATSSCISLVKDLSNLIVVRTFSKSFGLAGLRIGYGVSRNSTLIKGLNAIRDSYNADAISVLTAHSCLLHKAYYDDKIKEVISQRIYLIEKLTAMGFYCLPSQANFILAKPAKGISSEQVYHFLKEHKILIRRFADSIFEEYIRISIGTESENAELLNRLSDIV